MQMRPPGGPDDDEEIAAFFGIKSPIPRCLRCSSGALAVAVLRHF
jgi:hypothetical protein